MNEKIKESISYTTQDIVEIGLYIALAILLDLPFLKFKIVQNGGSVSLNMLPLFFLTYRKGIFKSLISCGIIFGLLSCLFDGYGFITYPLDYLIGFGCISLAGLFKAKIFKEEKLCFLTMCYLFISILLPAIIRTLSSTLSGVLFYNLSFFASLAYNALYLLPSFGLVFLLLLVLYKPLFLVNKKYK